MRALQVSEYPEHSLLAQCHRQGAYTDCYRVDLGRGVTLDEFVYAFYTTPLFKLERLVLAWFASRPSTDDEARRLARGQIDQFAAWNVEARADGQLLMTDFTGATKSWLMASPNTAIASGETQLYFGSAIVPRRGKQGTETRMGAGFRLLLPLHRLYSRALLWSACRRLAK